MSIHGITVALNPSDNKCYFMIKDLPVKKNGNETLGIIEKVYFNASSDEIDIHFIKIDDNLNAKLKYTSNHIMIYPAIKVSGIRSGN